MSTNDFLPAGYSVPKSEGSYMKLAPGANKFRILSKPIVGWVDWKDKKPYRYHVDKKPAAAFDPKQAIKHFWAFVVFDYTAKKIAILELTQTGVLNSLQALALNPDWGSPINYDITITKTGSGMETKYATTPAPPKVVHKMISDLYEETPVNLDALFEGKDPFDVSDSTPAFETSGDNGVDDNDDDGLPF